MKLTEFVDSIRRLPVVINEKEYEFTSTNFIFGALCLADMSSYPSLSKFLNEVISNSKNADNMDIEYMRFHSGNKSVNSYVSAITRQNAESRVTFLIDYIATHYFYKWDKLILALQGSEYNPIHNYDMTETETGSSDTTTTPNLITTTDTTGSQSTDITTTSDSDDSTYGFNSSSAVPTDKGKETSHTEGLADSNQTKATGTTKETGNTKSDNVSSRTMSRQGNIGVTTTQKMISEEIELRRNTICDIMYEDMDRVLCLKIYE